VKRNDGNAANAASITSTGSAIEGRFKQPVRDPPASHSASTRFSEDGASEADGVIVPSELKRVGCRIRVPLQIRTFRAMDSSFDTPQAIAHLRSARVTTCG
jgi:hypothetical protein